MERVSRSSCITEAKKQPTGKIAERRERALCFDTGSESNGIKRTRGKMDKPLVLTILLQEEAANVELPESLPGSFHEFTMIMIQKGKKNDCELKNAPKN